MIPPGPAATTNIAEENRLRRRGMLRAIAAMRGSSEVFISDTTLRDGEQMPGVAFSTAQKVEIALALERAGVHSIDAGFAANGEDERKAIRAVAAAVREPVIMSLARALPSDIDCAAEALAARPRSKRGVGIFIGTSPTHREAKHGLSRNEVIGRIETAVAYAAAHFDLIAFGAEDSSRTEPDFLCECLRTAIDAGATSVAIPDTVGILLPQMAADLVRRVQDGVDNLDRALLAVHFHDDLGLAAANSLAAIEAGANVVQCTVGGLGERAGNAALEEVALALALHRPGGRTAHVRTAELVSLCRLVARLAGVPLPPHKAVAGSNVFATEAGIHQDGLLKGEATYTPYPPELVGGDRVRLAIGKHSGRNGLASRLAELGMMLDGAALDELLDRIKALHRPADADDPERLQHMAEDLAKAL